MGVLRTILAENQSSGEWSLSYPSEFSRRRPVRGWTSFTLILYSSMASAWCRIYLAEVQRVISKESQKKTDLNE